MNAIINFEYSKKKKNSLLAIEMDNHYVYSFSELDKAIEVSGSESNVNHLLGEKGANLALIQKLGILIPKGFTISTDACRGFYKQNPPSFPPSMWEETLSALHKLEEETGKKFGEPSNPLIVSCRSGAPYTVKGLLPSIINIGFNDDTTASMAALTNNPIFVWGNYSRLIRNYGINVLGIPENIFDSSIEQLKKEAKIEKDEQITPEYLQSLVINYKKIIESESRLVFPQDPFEQVRGAIAAVFNSWASREVVESCLELGIDEDEGTAVNIISMKLGNADEKSCTGYAFTRNPDTGEPKIFGEFILNTIGDDLKKNLPNKKPISELEKVYPSISKQFFDIAKKLEQRFKDMQKIEFTIEKDKLWILQTISGTRTPAASIRIANDMVTEGLLSKEEALFHIHPDEVYKLIQPYFKDSSPDKLFASGTPSVTSAAVGQIYFNAEDVISKSKSQKVILIQEDIPTDDNVIDCLAGVITSRWDVTSQNYIKLCQKGVAAVIGVPNLEINLKAKNVKCGQVTLNEGDFVSVDSFSGNVYNGQFTLTEPKIEDQNEFKKVLSWADEIRSAKGSRQSVNGSNDRGLFVWANINNISKIKVARENGAEGIGTFRMETLLDSNSIKEIQNMILIDDLDTEEGQNAADASMTKVGDQLATSLGEFFKEASNMPATVRLINQPISTFLPNKLKLIEEVSSMKAKLDIEQSVDQNELDEKEKFLQKVQNLSEKNPFIGNKGVRMCIAYPSFLKMQLKSIIEGACIASAKGSKPQPYILVPFICTEKEMENVAHIFTDIKDFVFKQRGVKNNDIDIKIGASIDTPRSALVSSDISDFSDFMCIGIRNMNSLAFGYTREQNRQNVSVEWKISRTDLVGSGRLITSAVSEGRKKSGILIGAYTETGGSKTVEFCHNTGIDYVTFSPYRLVTARIASAQAVLRNKQ